MPTCPIRRRASTCTTRWSWSSRIGEGGADIAEADALRHVWGYAAGLDMTRRDLQNAGQEGGQALGHGQGLRPLRADRPDGSGRRRSAIPATRPDRAGGQRQGPPELGPVEALIWSMPETIAYLSRPGDAGARRPDLQRHAGKRRGGGAWRPAGRRRGGRRHGEDAYRLMAASRCASADRDLEHQLAAAAPGSAEGAGGCARSGRDLPAGDQGPGRAVSARSAGGAWATRTPRSAA